MTNFDQKMNDFFEVAPADTTNIVPYEPIQSENLDRDLETDYQMIRGNYHELIDRGKDVIEDLLKIASDSERARDFEIVALLMKNVLDANQQLLDVHSKVRAISNYKQQKEEKTTNINNTMFVGSTAELSRILKDINEKSIIQQ